MIPCVLYAHLSGDGIISEQKDVHQGEQEKRTGRTLRTETYTFFTFVCLAPSSAWQGNNNRS